MLNDTAFKAKTGPKPQEPAIRFWAKVDKSAGPAGCWLWTASCVPEGYGKFSAGSQLGKSKTVPSHRYSYELTVGPIPQGYQVDHLCHIAGECFGNKGCSHRRCVNPAHLKVVTPRENVLRGNTIAAAQVARTHCPHGHEYNVANTMFSRKGHKRICRECARLGSARRYALVKAARADTG